MKRITLIAAFSLMALASCKKEEKTTTEINETGTDTTIVVKEEAPAVHDTVVVKEESSDGTSVNVSGDGINVDSKDGDNKTKVNVSNKGAEVEVKK